MSEPTAGEVRAFYHHYPNASCYWSPSQIAYWQSVYPTWVPGKWISTCVQEMHETYPSWDEARARAVGHSMDPSHGRDPDRHRHSEAPSPPPRWDLDR